MFAKDHCLTISYSGGNIRTKIQFMYSDMSKAQDMKIAQTIMYLGYPISIEMFLW